MDRLANSQVLGNRRIDFTDDQHSVMVCTGRIVRTKGNCAKQDKEFTCLFAVAFSNFHFFFFGGRILVFFFLHEPNAPQTIFQTVRPMKIPKKQTGKSTKCEKLRSLLALIAQTLKISPAQTRCLIELITLKSLFRFFFLAFLALFLLLWFLFLSR